MRKSLLLQCEGIIKVYPNADILDMALFEYVCGACNSPNMKKLIMGNLEFTWVAYQKIIDDMPYLKLRSKDVVSRRLKKMMEIGLLLKAVDKDSGNQVYWRIGPKIDEIMGVSTLESEGIDSKVGTLSTLKSDNNLVKDNLVNIKKTSSSSKADNVYQLSNSLVKKSLITKDYLPGIQILLTNNGIKDYKRGAGIAKSLTIIMSKYQEQASTFRPLNAFTIYFACKWYSDNKNGLPFDWYKDLSWIGDFNSFVNRYYGNWNEYYVCNIHNGEREKYSDNPTYEKWSHDNLSIALNKKVNVA